MTRLALALVLLAFSGSPARPAKPPAPAARLLALHNAERARSGLRPLSLSDRLAAAAQVQADYCAYRDLQAHFGPDGSLVGARLARAGYAFSSAAENVAAESTPEAALATWVGVAPHRAHVLGPFAHFGAATSVSRSGTRYWVAVYASPR